MNDDKPKLPKRLYYRLSEAADVLACTENDLLQMGVFGEIEIICRVYSKVPFTLVSSYSIYDVNDVKKLNRRSEKSELLYPIQGNDFVTCPVYALFDIDMNGFSSICRTSRIFEVIGGFCIADQTPLELLELLEATERLGENKVAIVDSLGFRFVSELMDSEDDTYAENNRVDVTVEKNDLFVLASEVERVIAGNAPTAEQKERAQDETKPVKIENPSLAVIGVMLKMLIEGKDGDGVSLRTASKTQEVIAEAVETFAPKYENRTGLAKKTVEGIFARANKYLESKKA